MKRTITVLTMLLLAAALFGCARGAAPDGDKQSEGDGGAGAATTQAVIEPDYEIQDVDISYLADNGEPLIHVTYQLVAFSDRVPNAKQINAALEAKLEAFRQEREGLSEYLNGPFLSTDSPYFYDVSAEVTHYGNGLLSLRHGIDWYMGGVTNYTSETVNYDLATGEEMTLKALFPDKEQVFRDAVVEYARTNIGEDLLEDPQEILNGIAYEDIPFYVEDNQVILRFPIYLFGSGAFGEPVIPSGVFLEE